jgi:C4-dicarboxylate-specific signal transduction histidine kinase
VTTKDDQDKLLRSAALQNASSILIARQRAEQRSEAYLAEAQRLSHTGSFGWRLSTSDVVWSEETFRIFQYDRTVTPAVERVLQRVHPEDASRVKQTIERASQDEKDFDFECRLLMPDESITSVHVVAHAISDESGSIEFVGAVMDLTAAKQAEEALRQAQANLAHVSRVTTLGEMAASIAHEVDQPLSGVVINANACLRFLTGPSPNLDEVRDGLQAIARDGRRASDVIARIRAFARRTPTGKEPVEINEVIREVLPLAESEVRRTRAGLRTDLAENLPRVLGDRVQLQQVVLNLLLNGLDAMTAVVDRPRELVISTQSEASERVHVAVQDSGSGIDPQLANRLFEAFYTTKRDGMGMGLSISRSIVEQHGGRLWAVPNDGPGTTFHFTV